MCGSRATATDLVLSLATFDTTDGGRLTYRLRAGPGSGPLLVLSHPRSTHAEVFEPFEAVWRGPTLAWNRRGFGGSSGEVTRSQEQDLADLLDHVGAERVMLLGLAAGGVPSVAFAGRWPERTAGLILVNSFLGQPAKFWFDRTGETPPTGDMAARELSPTFRAAPAAANWRRIAADVGQTDTGPIQPAKADLARIATLETLAIATGEEDLLFTPAMLAEAARLLPNAVCEVLPGVAHAAPYEDPAGFAAYLARTIAAFNPA